MTLDHGHEPLFEHDQHCDHFADALACPDDIRMRNADVIDLYERVKVGTKVVVM